LSELGLGIESMAVVRMAGCLCVNLDDDDDDVQRFMALKEFLLRNILLSPNFILFSPKKVQFYFNSTLIARVLPKTE